MYKKPNIGSLILLIIALYLAYFILPVLLLGPE